MPLLSSFEEGRRISPRMSVQEKPIIDLAKLERYKFQEPTNVDKPQIDLIENSMVNNQPNLFGENANIGLFNTFKKTTSTENIDKRLNLLEKNFNAMQDPVNSEVSITNIGYTSNITSEAEKSVLDPIPSIFPNKLLNVPSIDINKEVSDIERKKRQDEVYDKIEKKYHALLLKTYARKVFYAAKINKYHEVSLKKIQKLKKLRILLKMKEAVLNRHLNREYIISLIRMKLDNFAINNFTTAEGYKMNKNSFFSYLDIKNVLISNLMQQKSENRLNDINHLKTNIYTTRVLFYNTNIYQNMFQGLDINNIEIEEGGHFLSISDKNNTIRIGGSEVTFSLFINVLFLDVLDDLPTFVLEHGHSINKFTYGIVLLDYGDKELLNKLLLVLDYSAATWRKEIILVYYYKLRDSATISEDFESMKLIQDLYKIKSQIYYLYSITDYSTYYRDIVDYYNNLEVYQIFQDQIRVQEFKPFKVVSIASMYELFKKGMEGYLNDKRLFVNLNSEITEHNWVRFFVNVHLPFNLV